jgi:hypothetical protein
MTYVSEWGKTFNAAAVVFSKDISATTKGNKSQGAVLKKILEDAQSPKGVVAALATLDKIDISAIGKDKKTLAANIKLFKSALKKLEGEKKKYLKDLVETQNQKPTVSEQGFNIPTPMKKALPATYRQLKILQTEVEAIYARAENALDSAEKSAKTTKNIDKGAEKKGKVKGSDDAANQKLKAISEDTAMKNFVIAFGKSFKSSVAKGAACIQKIKASPDVATYNAEMNGCARDISQNLVNIGKLKKNPKFKNSSLAKKLTDPGAMARDILPYCNGDLRNLNANATEKDVKKALADFTALYKKIVSTYKDVIAGKIK